ncbi:MAG: preprotein translocase subunit SecE [Lachnospiraceae bacterium]|nr:preprotein translocase subunit SecE [Lachnospiraceae bacterium]
MEETGKKNTAKSTDAAKKPSFVKRAKDFCKGVKAEFKKIIWPNKEELKKQTTAVIVVSVVLGAFIRIYDMLCQFVISFIR